jgi:PAS domain S-box-containing protein
VKKREKDQIDVSTSSTSSATSSLYDAAEKKISQSNSVHSNITGQTAEELIHNLQVHQAELEIQAEELRRAYLTIEESRDQFLDLYEFAPLGYITLTENAIISQANLTAATLLGVNRINLINARMRSYISPGDIEIWDRYFLGLVKLESKLTTTIMLKRFDGSLFPARLESIRLPQRRSGQSIRVAIIDISNISATEKALRRSEERFRLALKNAPVSVAIQNSDLVFEWAYNQRTIAAKDIKGKKDTDLFIPEDAKHLTSLKHKVLKYGKKVHEKTWLTMNGKRCFLDLYLEPLINDIGEITGIGIATVDLTEQKNIEDALRNSEKNLQGAQELLEAVTKGTDVIIAAQDTEFRYIFFNRTYKEEIKRLTGKDLVIGMSMIEVYEGILDEQERTIKEWSKVLKGEKVNHRVFFDNPGENRKIYHVLHSPIRDTDGNIIGAGEVAYDITRQVQIEDTLRETKEYLNNLITSANAPIIVWDPEFRITRFNRAFEYLTGREAKEVIGNHLGFLFPETYQITVMDLIKKTLEGERWESVEIPILHINGEVRTVLWNSATILGGDGKTIISTIAQGQDITDRKKIEYEYKLRVEEYAKMNVVLNEEIRQRNITEIALNNTLSLLNATLESTADGIYVTDKEGKITNYNQNFVSMWSIPQTLLKLQDHEGIMKYVFPQLKYPEKFFAAFNEFQDYPARESFDMIEFINGKIFERYSKPQKIGSEVVGRVWSFRDITDRKHAEEKLISSLEEKEVLLREIHHRVKNNLQLISGLLDMTRMRTSDTSTYNILTDMILKIQTMAQIHTRLYESKQFGKINITDQIRDQVVALSNIYSHKGHEISCEIYADDVFLPVDQALPCALIINEILSNAFKHAFIGRDSGIIKISVVHENEKISIAVEDNGIGIPGTCDITRSTSLGVKLIRTLVQHQLKGILKITSDQGTSIVVEFPLNSAGI